MDVGLAGNHRGCGLLGILLQEPEEQVGGKKEHAQNQAADSNLS